MLGQRARDRPAPLRHLSSLLGRAAACAAALLVCVMIAGPGVLFGRGSDGPDVRLAARLHELGFTGRVESTLRQRLSRPIDEPLANIGRLLWFDTVTGLNGDNTCAGCHSPTNGFGDSQPIAIGIDNNGLVGPDRSGPRNMRRAPMVLNTAFFPSLMWNGRFSSSSGDPFDNSAGFVFPPPEGESLSAEPHLLVAQAFIPPTERTEVAGFAFPGDNDAIRAEVLRRLNAVPGYRRLFARVFPAVRAGTPISVEMFARAIAEFEFTLTFADSPIDRYARGDLTALDTVEKRGALLFFGKAGCVGCHSVSGKSNEMFSDFKEHAIGVPQLVPQVTNNQFDGSAANEDFGRQDFTGDPRDRYAFRTPSLRNVAIEAAYMHDGSFTSLAAAISHHLNARASLLGYDPTAQGLPPDLTGPTGPRAPLLAALDPLLANQIALTDSEFDNLVAFVRNALLDPRATAANLRRLVPARLPSGESPLTFEFGQTRRTPSRRPRR
ncbi:MAG: cytochrome c peroxidase [Actinomycetota bacterium]